MFRRAATTYWEKMGPYYKGFPEVWVAIGVTSILFYKISYGGKKAVTDKPSH